MKREFSIIALLVLAAWALGGCSSAVPFGVAFEKHAPKSAPDKSYRGVVNGVWKYDTTANEKRLTGPYCEASAEDAAQLADRYQVRVGIDRGMFIGEFSEVVLLPPGWSYSLDAVVNDGRTINVGDVVEVRLEPARGLRTVTGLVRKCDQAPLPDENPDWNIGCKRVEAFHKDGYGGETYYLTGF
ncbi:MAG: hypothetical protein U1F09_10655 [Steroidobacteraceae bacterium]